MGAGRESDALFAVETTLGFTVRLSGRYWAAIVVKHPDIGDRVTDIQAALRAPQEIRRSRRDPVVMLFYRSDQTRTRWVVAVAKYEGGDGFLVTAYRTDAIKEGERLWPR